MRLLHMEIFQEIQAKRSIKLLKNGNLKIDGIRLI